MMKSRKSELFDELIKIDFRKCSENQYAQVWNLYTEAFPKEERRTFEEQQKILKRANYYPFVYVKGEQVIGLLFSWQFGDYTYIEHFAIDSNLRGQAYGSLILSDFIAHHKNVYLEIEPVCDVMTEKRFLFYQRFGFILNLHKHLQIVFGKYTPQNFRLDILSQELISDEDYRKLYVQMQRDLV